MKTNVLLDVRGLAAWYRDAQILFGMDLQVRRGEVVALLGRNGAGKSTTFRSLMGLVEKRRGTVRFMDRDLSRSETHRIAAMGMGYVPEDRRIFTDLTVMQNLAVGRRPERAWPDGSPAPSWSAEAIFELFPNLRTMTERSAARMSGGEQKMLAVARTLMGNPFLVLLDEPSEGVAPRIVEELARTIQRLKAQGLSILLSEQNLHFARLVADRAYVLEKGVIRGELAGAELHPDQVLSRTYLTI